MILDLIAGFSAGVGATVLVGMLKDRNARPVVAAAAQGDPNSLVDLKSSQAQIQRLQKMNAVGRLAGGVAHDFNNMLGAVTMYCDMIADEPQNTKEVLENVSQIREVAERGAALTRQLLVFGRRQISVPSQVDLNRLFLRLHTMLSRLIGDNIRIVSQLGEELGLVRVDAGHMEQVIVNLAVNARDAMTNGGTITVKTERLLVDEKFAAANPGLKPGPHVLLSLTDTGTGMDTATLSRVFEPFFTTKPLGKGVGLGLSTVYGIVRQSNGTIAVESEKGKGSVFKIYLPICKDLSVEPQEEQKSETRTPVARAQTVLLVEDEDRLRKLFSALLEKNGYKVLAAPNGVEALALCKSHPGQIDLLLTDVMMPGMGGLELAKNATEARRGLRVIFMSGYTDETLDLPSSDDELEFVLLQKPFTTRTLISKIQGALSPV